MHPMLPMPAARIRDSDWSRVEPRPSSGRDETRRVVVVALLQSALQIPRRNLSLLVVAGAAGAVVVVVVAVAAAVAVVVEYS